MIRYHIGGHLKTAPEHVDPNVLDLMHKPPIEKYDEFCELFATLTEKNGKDQYLVPYLIAGLPGSNYDSMVKVAEYLKQHHIRPEQVQDFIPAPFELATCMFYTGIEPMTGKPVSVPRGLRERRLQHALLMYYNPANYHDVKSALKEAHREDLIGTGPNCLIPPYPPKADSLRQSSRVKRLQRQNEEEKREKEERREAYRGSQENRNRSSRPRSSDRRDGGYRGE
ncbi:MAG: DUF3362 domain-containing protein, partial [Planctomycetia bacterium]|nr:DUF3362 domain-containing protein [Planctomycetia bacterium]